MQQATFEEFRRIVYSASGIMLGPRKEALVAARLGKRMRALGITDYEAYLEHVTADESGREMVQLVDAISTNVTSFFREADHFAFLAEDLVRRADAGASRFRYWSAACSTGEEAYSMAITLLEAAAGRGGMDVKVLATDISSRALVTATAGVYDEAKAASVPEPLLERYFVRRRRSGKVRYEVRREVKDIVVFRRHNLSARPYPIRGPLDGVFLRNVMIYFDHDVRRALLSEVRRLLRPGGHLFVGHAESLAGQAAGVTAVRPSVYVKP